MMQGPGLPPELTKLLLTDLRSRSEDVRQRGAKALAAYVAEQARELQGDTFTKMRNELNRLIFELVNSPNSVDRLAAVQAIEELIDIDYDENLGTKITRLATHLRAAISFTDPTVVSYAARAIGHLAKANTSSFSLEFVEFEVKRSFEWLQYEPRRYAAVTVLRQLASAVPTLFIVHVSTFFDQIWVALRDLKDHVREAAAEAVGACLQLVAERENGSLHSCYDKTFEEAQLGFKGNTPETAHGSLLIFGEILLHTGTLFMRERFQEVCQTVLKYKSHPNRLVRRTVITLLPRLASCYPDQFVQNYLPMCMEYLLETLKKLTDANLINYGSHALIAMGDIALAVGAYINPYLDSVIKKIKSIILKKKDRLYTAAITCTCMLATAVGFALVPYMKELPQLLFSTGLSPALMEALGQIARNIPDHRFAVQMQLLDQISLVLVSKPYNVRAWPSRGPSPQLPQSDTRATATQAEKDHAMVALVLRTLHTFDFEGITSLPEFARYSVSPYLDEDDVAVRTEAALACCRLIRDAPQQGHIGAVVSAVLRKLVSMAISDPDAGVRTTIIGALDPRLDYYLAQTDYLSQLFLIINDETFVMREQAVKLLGRLAERNPANVIPRLRAELIRLKQDLVAPVAEKTREESSLLLMHIISTPYDALVRPYVEPLLKVLLPRLRDPNPRVSANVLRAVGELSRVGRDHLQAHMAMLTPLIIDTLRDQGSAAKREVALRALSQLTKSSGAVIDPLIEYPLLLEILLSEVKAEPVKQIRRAAMKVLGELGALDPDRMRTSQLTKKAGGAHENEAGEKSHAEKPKTKGENLLLDVTPSSDDYYPVVAFTALLRILKDPSLESLHTRVIEGMVLLFRASGTSAPAFLAQLMPPFITLIRGEPDLRGFLFQQMSKLVTILKHHMREYAEQLFNVVREYWSSNCLVEIVNLVQEIAESLRSDFARHLPELLPLFVSSLSADTSAGRGHTLKLLSALRTIDSFLQEEAHSILPSVVRLVEHADQPNVQKEAVSTLRHLTSTLDLSQHAARIVHPLLRALDTPPHSAEFTRESLEVLFNLCFRMQLEFANTFHPVVAKVLARHRISAPQYEALLQRVLKNEKPRDDGAAAYEAAVITERRNSVLVIPAAGTDVLTIKKLKMNEQNLRKAWEVAQRSTKEDWLEWIRWFAVEQLRESPSPALRSCLAVAQSYHPLAQELFNAAFVSNWTELEEEAKKDLIKTLQTALASPNIPPELLQTLLNLAEFMEHDERPLPLDVQMLSGLAEKCKAYAKALHYKENEFHATPTSEVVESLIAINSHLQEQEAAVGILKHVQQRHGIQLRESWYEKLDRWEEALEAYERKQRDAPNNVEFTLGRMRCLRSLGEWERLGALADSVWRSSAPDATRRAVAPLATAAAWNLGQWSRMDEYLTGMRELTVDSSFFRAVSCVHREQYAEAQRHVDATRDLMANELGALVSESYGRAYTQLVLVQQLAEIEEVITYRKSDDQDSKARILRTMKRRLLGCQRDLDVWQRVLSVHSLVMSEEENIDAWLKLASIARRRGRLGICARTLRRLLQMPASATAADSPLINTCPRAPLAYIKFLWASGAKQTALEQLRALSQKLPAEAPIQAKCFLRLGVWQREMLTGELKESSIRQVLGFLEASTRQNNKSYKAWHSWALFNFEVIAHYERPGASAVTGTSAASSPNTIPANSSPSTPAVLANPNAAIPYVVAAVTGFFNSIALGQERGLQDILRVLTLLFNHGSHREVEEALLEGFKRVSVDTWLHVIPQIIARIHIPAESQRRLIHNLLSDLGRAHPQALVYPLTVASKSQSAARIAAADSLMNRMRAHSSALLDQALLVSQELIRVAILWHELWYEGLEEAYRLFILEDIEGMFTILSPLHAQLERGAETPNEVYFVQMMGPDLQAAWETCRRYHRSGKVADLNKAWDVYHNIFRRIRHLPVLNMLELRQVSPRLLSARNLSLAVPGTYREGGGEVVTIRSFHESLPVISSKQRPRKLLVHGSDGMEYTYLLKGHEDIRQDERVMQLFGLVNSLLAQNDTTSRHNLSIQRYAVIPLSPNSGLIGWVPQCDTLHALIRDYRNGHRIPLDLERRLMLQIVPDGSDTAYERLMLMQKVEAFEHALTTTGGMDMNRILWLKSTNSEMWLFRRNNYTRSLAVMSMVGYVLGLGDRHPNNLMLDRLSGKIMHIDFGDCFEVAMTRERYSEKVPFRLTRMLVNAMEAGGIEGNFKVTCETVMQVLRDNKDSLMAMLEAFVYDPLINWRLLTAGNTPAENPKPKKDKFAAAAANPAQPASSPVAMLRMPELLNDRAVSVLQRVSRKLTGRDFGDAVQLDVPTQVQRLIEEASSAEALCQSYMGWCPFW